MNIQSINSLQSLRATGMSEEIAIARTTEIPEEQVRIAEKSTDRRVLMALATNKDLDSKAVEALYGRNIDGLTRRLDSLGYGDSK